MKKNTTIKLDEELLKKAREQIPNLSAFVTVCLEKYIGVNHEEFEISSIQDELDRMKEANLNIHILSERNQINTIEEEAITKKENDVWLSLWGAYRNTETVYQPALDKASEVLAIDKEELLDILDTLVYYIPKKELIYYDDWKTSYNKYKELMNDK